MQNHTYRVTGMTCGHCVSTITKAVKALDAGARVQIDLASHRVEIDSRATNATQMGAAIKEAGYTPEDLWNLEWNPEDGGTYEEFLAASKNVPSQD